MNRRYNELLHQVCQCHKQRQKQQSRNIHASSRNLVSVVTSQRSGDTNCFNFHPAVQKKFSPLSLFSLSNRFFKSHSVLPDGNLMDDVVDSHSVDIAKVHHNNNNNNNNFLLSVHPFLKKIRQSLCQDILPTIFKQPSNKSPPDSSCSCVVLLSVSGGCDSIGLLHSIMQLVEPIPQRSSDRDSCDGFYSNLQGSTFPQYYFHCCDDELIASDDNKRFAARSNPIPESGKKIVMELHVVHFDHCQRGIESDGDRQFVEHLCKHVFGLPFHCFYWYDDYDGIDSFSQEAARMWRISKLSQLLQSLRSNQQQQQNRPGLILTAHHQDDSNETLLLKLLRGVHLSNLSGMEPFTTISFRSGEEPILLGRPMLGVTKSSIKDFLQSQQLTWREDASNQSNKYLRNRIRNELIPLLTDIVGGEDALQKRLDNLAQQSREIHDDTSQRVNIILEQYASVSENYFILENNTEMLDYIHKQAIFSWANQVMKGHILPYDQFVRLCVQLDNPTNRRQWTINIGGGWDVIRNGNALKMKYQGSIVNEQQDNNCKQQQEEEVYWIPWVEGCDDVASTSDANNTSLRINVPFELCSDDHNMSNVQFVLVKSNVDGMPFTPSWRKNHTPVKIREFLRGQRVPLHMRSTAPTILARQGSISYVVAVYVSEGNRWVIDARFAPPSSDIQTDGRSLLLRLAANSKI